MAYFRVEGTSRVSWSLLVEAASEEEAAAIARRTAGSQSELRREDALQGVDHHVGRPLSLGLGEPSNGNGRSPRSTDRDATAARPASD